jgi:hypothetical protein
MPCLAVEDLQRSSWVNAAQGVNGNNAGPYCRSARDSLAIPLHKGCDAQACGISKRPMKRHFNLVTTVVEDLGV